jgi:hypothetical protein
MAKQVLVAAALVLAVATCGGGHRSTPAPSLKAFVARADRICAQATTRSGRLARLRALRPPASTADLYAHWLTAEQDAVRAAEVLRDPSKKTELDPTVALVIAEGKVTGYARRLGADACARRIRGTMPP